ncbi:hypothetical protein [Plantactinospora sp. BC1]|uniref:hypothetical protein n=1 Tax=Plantactinospora sp. BC1 TaxID=2108470 RepID=UPI0018FE7E20
MLVAGVGLLVGPFVEEGAVEAFGFAVGLWSVAAGEAGLCADRLMAARLAGEDIEPQGPIETEAARRLDNELNQK